MLILFSFFLWNDYRLLLYCTFRNLSNNCNLLTNFRYFPSNSLSPCLYLFTTKEYCKIRFCECLALFSTISLAVSIFVLFYNEREFLCGNCSSASVGLDCLLLTGLMFLLYFIQLLLYWPSVVSIYCFLYIKFSKPRQRCSWHLSTFLCESYRTKVFAFKITCDFNVKYLL